MIAAISLPSIIGIIRKPEEYMEGKQNIGVMNRAQQAYQLENNSFANSLGKLMVGISPKTKNHKTSISLGEKAVFHHALAKKDKLKSYFGAVFLVPDKSFQNQLNTEAIICEVDFPLTKKPKHQNGVIACGANTINISH
ncbi:general secretion pathway protein H [Cylindrospermum sp. NIES-4074]|nr:general secretion pathway protein H [Cylindrospermum sp. NIES-4074]